MQEGTASRAGLNIKAAVDIPDMVVVNSKAEEVEAGRLNQRTRAPTSTAP